MTKSKTVSEASRALPPGMSRRGWNRPNAEPSPKPKPEMQGSKEHLARLKDMLKKAKPGSADHSQIRHAISSMFGDEHLKEGIMSFREFRESAIVEGWLRHRDGGYSAETSELDGHIRQHGSARCPGCREPIDTKKFKAHKDRDGDVTMYTHQHHCGARMTVYND